MKHSFWNWFFVVCSLSTLRGCPLLAQDAAPNVVIGSTTVRIGMFVDAVTTQLQARGHSTPALVVKEAMKA